ncbi:MAG: hypothetical protein GY906_17965 [bacterium]|nr:hypothetical protein [bacterium]
MQTTSLPMSKALKAAGFWEKRELADWWWLYVNEDHPGREAVSLRVLTSGQRYKDKQHVPAATYDDLIPALGLDKPFFHLKAVVMAALVNGSIYKKGFTCDALAQLWLDEHNKSSLTPPIKVDPPPEQDK